MPIPGWIVSANRIRNLFATGVAGTITGANRKSLRVILSDIVDNLPASATHPGIVELATGPETVTGTDAVRAVTPAGLASKVATETTAGLVELATDAETRAVSASDRAITPAGLGTALINALRAQSFAGVAAAGPATLVGAVVGDIVLSVCYITSGSTGFASSSFESVITVDGQIQQTSGDNLSAHAFLALIWRPGV